MLKVFLTLVRIRLEIIFKMLKRNNLFNFFSTLIFSLVFTLPVFARSTVGLQPAPQIDLLDLAGKFLITLGVGLAIAVVVIFIKKRL